MPYPRWQRTTARFFTTGAVALELLYAYFLYVACSGVGDNLWNEMGIEDHETRHGLQIGFNMVVALLVVINLISDSTSVNVVEDAEDVLELMHQPRTAQEGPHPVADRALTVFNQSLAAWPFVVSSAADLVTWSYFFSDLGAILGIGLPSMAFGVAYYYMFSGANLARHAVAMVKELSLGLSFMRQALKKAPARFLESCLQAGSNIAYQTVARNYILLELLTRIFKKNSEDPGSVTLLYFTTAVSVYITMQSRILPVFNRFFKDGFDTITSDLLKQVPASRSGMAIDLAMACSRGGPLAYLLYCHLPGGEAIQLSTALTIGSIAAGHHFYALQQTRKLDAILAAQPQKTMVADEPETATELFDAIAKHCGQKPSLDVAYHFVNVGARAARWIAFVGFLVESQQAFKIHLNFRDLLCLASIWGVPTLAGDGKVYLEGFKTHWPYFMAKYKIGIPVIETEDAAQRSCLNRTVSAFYTPKKKYAPAQLRQVLQTIQEGTSAPLLTHGEA